MDRLDAMSLFVDAVDAGSLAGAARRHGRSPAAATRAVALLEKSAGETLLLRSTRKLSLTPAGERHLAVWREVLARLRELAPEEAGKALQGNIVFTAPELFGRMIVMPLLEDFLCDHPLVSLRALMVNRIVNLVGEGVDLAVRLAPLPDSSLMAVKLGFVREWLCASPDYLAQAPRLETLRDLDRHDCIGLNAEGDAELWPFAVSSDDPSRVRSVRVRTKLSVNNAALAIDAALRGHGVIYARSYQVAEHIVAGRLVRLLREHETLPVPVNLVFPADRARNAVVRAMIDHLTPQLRQELAVLEGRQNDSLFRS